MAAHTRSQYCSQVNLYRSQLISLIIQPNRLRLTTTILTIT